MRTLFDVLDEVRRRPTMYVGFDDQHRLDQLKHLESMILGYELALHEHQIDEPGTNFHRRFMEFIRRTRGWDVGLGIVFPVQRAAKSEQEAWELFWKLVEEFRQSLTAEETLAHLPPPKRR